MTWSDRSTTSKLVVVVGCTVGAAATLVTLRVSARIYRLFSHREEVYSWLSSIIPPSDYDYKTDTPQTREYVAKTWPQLLDIVDQGTLTVLTRPPDFDRALPDELLILGTAHVSKKTAEAVYRCISTTEPDAVVMELCKSRAFMMHREVPVELLQTEAEQLAATTTATTSTSTSTSTAGIVTDSSTADSAQSAAPSCQGAGTAVATQRQEPSLSSQLTSLVEALKTTGSPLQALLGWAYAKVEGQLGTVAGLEFIRARQAIQDIELKRQQRRLSRQTSSSQSQPPSQSPSTVELSSQQPPAVHTHHIHLPRPASKGSYGDGAEPTRPGQEAASESGPESDTEDAGPSVHIYLGDVPLQRTISRTWGVLSFRQKCKLCWTLLHDCLTLKADDEMLEALLQEDVFQLMQRELGDQFPEAMGPLLHERNWQLSYTVQQAAQHGMRRVVLVVGRGHVPGVIYCLLHPYRLRKNQRADREVMQGRLASVNSAGDL